MFIAAEPYRCAHYRYGLQCTQMKDHDFGHVYMSSSVEENEEPDE